MIDVIRPGRRAAVLVLLAAMTPALSACPGRQVGREMGREIGRGVERDAGQVGRDAGKLGGAGVGAGGAGYAGCRARGTCS